MAENGQCEHEHTGPDLVCWKCGDEGPRTVEQVAANMADSLRAVLAAVEVDPPYPWSSGHLKQQIREDITAYELLGLDAQEHHG